MPGPRNGLQGVEGAAFRHRDLFNAVDRRIDFGRQQLSLLTGTLACQRQGYVCQPAQAQLALSTARRRESEKPIPADGCSIGA
ncbi:hypothetical protein D3C72_1949490 [compost metagenome]